MSILDNSNTTRVAAVLVGMIFGAYVGFALSNGTLTDIIVELTVVTGGVVLAVVGLG